jgi:hypothetical protein
MVNPYPLLLGNLKSLFCRNENKSWMGKAKYFFKIKNASQKILTNFFGSEVSSKNVVFTIYLVVALFSHKPWLWLWL